ncbi:MAG: photosystem II stability/assembly factor-like uncharacterized protein [Maribacter sp.]|jgi:photosystem II stability/assembly factor-like uncharacterized protein
MKLYAIKFLIFSLIISSTSLLSHAQDDWRAMMGNPNIDFSTIQESFYAEFGDRIGGKGSGWKQFKRWEYYHEQRLNELGQFPEPGNVLSEIIRYRETHPTNTRSYDAGSGDWELLGPTSTPNNGTGQLNGNGRITCITFHPTDPNTIYVGAPSGGVWKTTDNGATWTQFISGLVRLGVSDIVIHPTNPDIIYIATGDRDAGDAPGYGVWRSIDGGLNWTPQNSGMGNRTINEVLMDPNDPNIMVAAGSNGRIYRTTDGGANWASSASLGYNPKDIAYHPTNSNIVYASGSEVHKSTDGGITWTEITNGVPSGASRIGLAVSPDEPNWVYLLAGDGSGLIGIYRSTDSGTSFTTRTTTPNIFDYAINGSGNDSQAWYDLVITADPTDASIIYTGGINIWKSIDGGTTMNCVSYWVGPSGGISGVHADQHVLEFSPYTNHIYNGNDGGIYISPDSGVNWDDLSDGLAIAQMYKIGVSQQTLDRAINGYQDNGTAINDGTAFRTEIGGDGMECIIDPTDDNFMYGALFYGDIRRSTNGGIFFNDISGSISETGAWVTPYKLDPNDANRMFAGYDNVWRNDAVRTGTAWTQISNFTNTSNIRDIAIAPSNSNIVYVSKYDNSFRISINALSANPTWTNLSANLPINNDPLDIEIDHTDPTHLFIALNNNIYESTNSGNSWTDISGTLPNISLNTILIDKNSPNEGMYVGMDAGVYYKDNTGANWVLYADNLPNIEITELEIHYDSDECRSTLYAATYGQGSWKSNLKDPGNVAPVACFESSTTDICLGATITLSDKSDYTPTSWTWTITPATFTFVNGTDANSQNPQIVFTAAGTYDIRLNAGNANGNDLRTKNAYITVFTATIAASFSTDFESEALCGVASDCASTVCSIANPLWKNLTNGTEDDIDWRIDEGGTPSAGTGPSVDLNPGTNNGNYAYTEASSCSGGTAILESTCMELDTDYSFVLGYHMTGDNVGELHLDINTGGAWTLDFVPVISGEQGSNWLTSTTDLAAYTGQTIKLRIRGTTGIGFQSDIAIDDIALVHSVAVPITLVFFDAKSVNNNSVKLQWATATEQNTDLYEIQRSSDAISWTSILKEEAAGNSNSLLNYETWDRSPLTGISYYRLKDIDFDGQFSYSEIKSVNIEDSRNMEIKVFPNPTENEITIEGDGINLYQVRFYDLLGKDVTNLVIQKSSSESQLVLDLFKLNNGVYYLKTNTITNKIYKQ